MKNLILPFIIFLVLSFGELTAQKKSARPFKALKTEVIAYNDINQLKPYLEEDWSKESLQAIDAITKKHGKPYQISSRNLIWFVNSTCNQTINFSESFSLEMQENNFNDINYCKPVKYIYLLPIETGICTNIVIKKSL